MAETPDWTHQAVFAPQSIGACLARDFVCIHLSAHGLQHLVDDVRLVVSELSSNAVAHAGTPFTVTLSCTNGSVLLDVEDESTSTPVTPSPGVMDMSGRGLMIVDLLSKDWGTRPGPHGAKSVWALFASAPQSG